MKCIHDLQKHKKTPEYKKAVDRSRKRADDHRRLSQQIWHESQKLAKAKMLSLKAKERYYWDLREWEQKLVEDYDTGRLERALQELVSERTPMYRGIGASVQSS